MLGKGLGGHHSVDSCAALCSRIDRGMSDEQLGCMCTIVLMS